MTEAINFQLYRAHPDDVIWKQLRDDDKYTNKQVCIFIHQTMFGSSVEKKKCYVTRFTPLRKGCLIILKNCRQKTENNQKFLIKNFNST